MKRTLFLTVLIFQLYAVELSAQNFFENDLEYFTIRMGPTDQMATDDLYAIDFFRERLTLDSAKNSSQYYSVKRTTMAGKWSLNSINYQLFTTDSSVFYKGPIYAHNDTFNSSLLVYDFRLKANDSVKYNSKILPCNTRIVAVDSVLINDKYVLRQEYDSLVYCEEYSGNTGYKIPGCFKNNLETYLGIGSNVGLLPFNNERIGMYWGGPSANTLLSVCEKGALLFALPCVKEKYAGYNLCDTNDVLAIEKHLKLELSIDKPKPTSISLYPNPVKDNLQVLYDKPFEYVIYNQLGSQIKTGSKTSQIDVSELETGFYFIKLNTSNEVLNLTFLKN